MVRASCSRHWCLSPIGSIRPNFDLTHVPGRLQFLTSVTYSDRNSLFRTCLLQKRNLTASPLRVAI